MRFFEGLALTVLLAAHASPAAGEPPPGPQNLDFARWADGVPAHWRREVGRTSGGGPASIVERGPEGGLALAGGPETTEWAFVAQAFAVEPGTSYRLRFEARAPGTGAGGSPPGAYVGVAGRREGRLDLSTLRAETTFRAAWTPCEAIFRAATREADVIVFLPAPGRLEVRAMRWEALAPRDTFDALVAHMARTYSYLGRRVPDWTAHAAALRERALAAAGEPALVDVLSALLAPLDDAHVSIRLPDGRLVVPAPRAVDAGFDGKAAFSRLASGKPIPRVGFHGLAAEGVGYVAVGALPAGGDERAALLAAFEERLDDRALIVDLRANGGGDERTAQAIGAMLADTTRVYAKRRFRSGPAPDDFGPWIEARVSPRAGKRFAGPVVAILGPFCMSSGEGFAQLLSVIPNVTTIGKPTRGASGSPAPADLPGGITVTFSRWQNAMPDGTLLEGRGVAPQEAVDLGGPDDPALRRAIAIAKAKLAQPPR